MPNLEIPLEKIVFTDSFSAKGRAYANDGKLEVIGALPGEQLLVQLGGKRKKIRQAYLRKVLTPSKDRVQPLCPYVPDCGGCAWQQVDYQIQLKLKEELVQQEFATLIQKYQPEVKSIISCEDPWRYRNKMEFSFSQNRMGEKFLGLMLAGSRGRVLNLTHCYLVSDWFSSVLNAVRNWWDGLPQLKAYFHSNDSGHIRTMTVREAKQGKGKMVMLTVSGNPSFAFKREWMNSFVECIKSTTVEKHLSIFLQIQQIAKGLPTQFFEMVLSGPDHITEKLHIQLQGKSQTLAFKISPTSFFQPNTIQAEKLYSTALESLSSLNGARVFDLYCGGATIGLSAAAYAKEVVGIELNHHGVFDAGWNREVNQIENFTIHQGDVGKILEKLKQDPQFAMADVVIVDPPRSGLDEKALNHLKDCFAKEILYISCNPKTQAINIEALCQAGYSLKLIHPVDQFPHTVHIENICLLQKN